MRVEVTTESVGPLFDGRAIIAYLDYVDHSKREIAQQGMAEVHHILDRVLRDPTPFYETLVRVERDGRDQLVNAEGTLYGHWLEGVGSRNETTRFKGYHHWRIARQVTEIQAGELAERVLRRYLPLMGG